MSVAAQVDVLIFNLEMRFAVRAHREVGIVAGMVAFWILQAMLLSIGIKMRPRRLEIWGIALGILMKVDGVFAGNEILKIHFHPDSRTRFPKNGATYYLSLGIFQLHKHLGGTGGCERHQEHCEREQASGFHAGIIAKPARDYELRANR